VKNATLHNNPNNNWYTPTVFEVKVYGNPVENGTFPSPAAVFDFENGSGDMKLYGNANTSQNMLSLDGTADTYAQLPDGILDGCTDYTLIMDAKSNSTGDFFTFALGKDNIDYSFFKIARDHFRFATTIDSWGGESGLRYDLDGTQWHRYILVVNGASARLYVDGVLVSETTELTSLVSEMGIGLKCYIGKSFYEADVNFTGEIDNLTVYRTALNEAEIASLSQVEGDVNADGLFSVSDLVCLSEFLLNGKQIPNGKAADLINDNHIDVFDMIKMREKIISY
jgi:hypothetical protein